MSGLLEGRVALVTGGARGIGRAIASRLHEQGAALVIADNGTAIDGSGADAPARQRPNAAHRPPAQSKTSRALREFGHKKVDPQSRRNPSPLSGEERLALEIFGMLEPRAPVSLSVVSSSGEMSEPRASAM